MKKGAHIPFFLLWYLRVSHEKTYYTTKENCSLFCILLAWEGLDINSTLEPSFQIGSDRDSLFCTDYLPASEIPKFAAFIRACQLSAAEETLKKTKVQILRSEYLEYVSEWNQYTHELQDTAKKLGQGENPGDS